MPETTAPEQTAPALSENQYKAIAYAFYCDLEITRAEFDLIETVDKRGGIELKHGNPVFNDCPIDRREFRKLEKRGFVENRGFGFRTTISGAIQLSIFRGENPWYGGPILTYEKAIERGIIRRKTPAPV